MKKYSETDNYVLFQGNMLDMLQEIKENSIDSIVTDPPYGLTSITKRFGKENSVPAQYGKDGAFSRLSKGFMGKEWDGSGIEYNIETWKKCFEVLKPGGYLLAFGGTRTYHRIACAIEDTGFEIRDCIMWLYGSGFPKSMNIGLVIDKKNGVDNRTGNIIKGVGSNNTLSMKNGISKTQEFSKEYEERIAQNEWNGWGTCLKPAYEPIIVARKPFKGSLVDNVIENRVGGLNIDECRVGNEFTKTIRNGNSGSNGIYGTDDRKFIKENPIGRFPANVILTYDETDFDEVCGVMPYTKSVQGVGVKRNARTVGNVFDNSNNGFKNEAYDENKIEGFNDSGSASRYFYCAKASQKDRDEGLDEFEDNYMAYSNQAKAELKRGHIDFQGNCDNPLNFVNKIRVRKNTHPTVKPTELMQYLIRLVSPKGATILDPFMGSGSTGKAVMYENKERNADYKFIGIELTEEYLPIAKARINYAMKQSVEENKEKQLSIFEME